MPLSLLLLGLVSVGSIVFFARFALLRPGAGSVPVQRYDFVDFGVVLLLTAYNLYVGYFQLTHAAAETVTFQMLVANAVLALAVLTLVFGVLIGRLLNPLELFGLWGKAPRTVVGTALLSLVALVPLILFCQLLTTFFMGATEAQPLILFLQKHPKGADLAMFLFTALILAPFTEEVLFRGYLYGVYKRCGGRVLATVLSAFVFAAVHGHLPSMPGLFVLAVALTLAYEYTGSLWTTMLIHAGFNSISVIVALYWPQLG